MKLRKLEERDAPFMLEWMHDPIVVEHLNNDFTSKTIYDCIAFIKAAQDMREDLHLAIVSDKDEYMGTVSLKHIDPEKLSAEFAITIRKSAMGMGYSKYAMHEILRIGNECLGLKQIYWCVDPNNKRAIHFYEKNGYKTTLPNQIPALKNGHYSFKQINNYQWYIYDNYSMNDNYVLPFINYS